MALILGVLDGDQRRRSVLRAALPGSLSGLPFTERRSVSFGSLEIQWEASRSALVSFATAGEEGARRCAWVVGHPYSPYGAAGDAAERALADAPERSALRRGPSRNGFHLALWYDESPRLRIGVDTLGLFPLYYWSGQDVCLFGTSPELFALHPSFRRAPDLRGIASVLLVNHLCGGHSLYEGVRRLGVAHVVEWTPSGVREFEDDPLRSSDAGFGQPYEECLGRVTELLDAYHRSLAGVPRIDQFLSGGQDSRAVAGFAARHLPRGTMRAVSLGIRSDQELTYARKVSQALGWPHRSCDVDFSRYADLASDQLRLESLQGPFASFDTRTAMPVLAERGGPFLSGYIGDPVVGDGQVMHAITPSTGEIEFATLLRALNGYGLPARDVAALLPRPDGEAAVRDVLDTLEAEWRAIDAPRFQRAWLFALTHRIRYHVGSIVWRLSLGAWPLMPYYERALLDAMASMPLHYLRGRRMQADIIRRQFPRLATLPLDRNAPGPEYLVTPLHRKFFPPLADVSWTLHRLVHRREPRYFHRTYDFNASGWVAVRRAAERHRQAAKAWLDGSRLDALLPLPDARPAYANAVRDASGPKTLLGLVMWYGTNFGHH